MDNKLNEFEWIFMSMHNKTKNEVFNASLRTSEGTILTDAERNPISQKESSVLKSIPKQCFACSYTMNTYLTSENEEKTLGNNIFSFLKESKDRCENCSDNKLNHTSYIYKNDGRINISFYNLNKTLNKIDKVSAFLGFDENSKNKENINKKVGEINLSNKGKEIYSYGVCEQWLKIVTPIIKFPKEILNLSATKFYQNILFNTKLINFGEEKRNILNISFQNTIIDINEDYEESYTCQK